MNRIRRRYRPGRQPKWRWVHLEVHHYNGTLTSPTPPESKADLAKRFVRVATIRFKAPMTGPLTAAFGQAFSLTMSTGWATLDRPSNVSPHEVDGSSDHRETSPGDAMVAYVDGVVEEAVQIAKVGFIPIPRHILR